MIKDWQLQTDGDRLILGIATESSHIDIMSDRSLLRAGMDLLGKQHQGLIDCVIGHFGDFNVRLNVHHDDAASVFIDGPDFNESRCQSAAIYVNKDELQNIFVEVLSNQYD